MIFLNEMKLQLKLQPPQSQRIGITMYKWLKTNAWDCLRQKWIANQLVVDTDFSTILLHGLQTCHEIKFAEKKLTL